MKTTRAKLKTTQNHQLENRKKLFAIFSPPNVLKSEANGFHCCQIHNFAIITKRSSPAVDAVPECGSHFSECSSACSVDFTVWNVVFMYCVVLCAVLCADQIRVHRSQCTAWCEQITVPFVLWQKCTAMQCTAHSGRKLPRFPASLAIISIIAQSVANPTICLFSNLVCV